MLHDCNPPTAFHATHEQHPGAWNGTVYKALLELRISRKDLEIFTVDTDWGIGIVRFGNATNINAQKVQEALKDFNSFDLNRIKLLNLISPDQFIEWLKGVAA